MLGDARRCAPFVDLTGYVKSGHYQKPKSVMVDVGPRPGRHVRPSTVDAPFASAAQQQAPAPRGPILSELASVNGRGGGVLLEKGALRLLEWKTPPRRGGAPGGKLNTAAFALAPADI